MRIKHFKPCLGCNKHLIGGGAVTNSLFVGGGGGDDGGYDLFGDGSAPPRPESQAWNIAGKAEAPGRQALPPETDTALPLPVSMTRCSVSGFTAACPVLCSGNGQYSKGTCQCYSGWKGAECDVPMNQCIDPSCGGHGSCIDGTCVCSAGYKGEHCEEGERRRAGRGGAGWAAGGGGRRRWRPEGGVCRPGPLLTSPGPKPMAQRGELQRSTRRT